MFTITVDLQIPQLTALTETLGAALERLGALMADRLDTIRDQIEGLKTDLTAELVQIEEALRAAAEANPTPAAITAIADDVGSLRQRVRDIIPDAPPAPPTGV